MSAQRGAGLVELIVALTVFTVGLLGLAAVAAVAQRALAAAEAIERSVDLASTVVDSLLRVADPQPGESRSGDVTVRWSVQQDSTATILLLTTTSSDAPEHAYRTVHSAQPR